MKKLLFFSTFILACLVSCQKTEIQSNGLPDAASADAIDGYIVGIGFRNQVSPRNGDANVTYNGVTSTDFVIVPFFNGNYNVTVSAIPNSGYIVDYWLQFDAQPNISSTGTRVNDKKSSFIYHAGSKGAWFEPVFKPVVSANATFETDGGGTYSFDSTPAGAFIDVPFTVSANPNPGMEFNYWTRNGKIILEQSFTETLTDNQPVSYVAHFKPYDLQNPESGTAVVFYHNQVEATYDYINRTTVEFTDPSGKARRVSPHDGTIGHTFTIKAGTSITVNVDVESRDGHEMYFMYKWTDGQSYKLTPTRRVVERLTSDGLYGYTEVAFRADRTDTWEDFLGQFGGGGW